MSRFMRGSGGDIWSLGKWSSNIIFPFCKVYMRMCHLPHSHTCKYHNTINIAFVYYQ